MPPWNTTFYSLEIISEGVTDLTIIDQVLTSLHIGITIEYVLVTENYFFSTEQASTIPYHARTVNNVTMGHGIDV